MGFDAYDEKTHKKLNEVKELLQKIITLLEEQNRILNQMNNRQTPTGVR